MLRWFYNRIRYLIRERNTGFLFFIAGMMSIVFILIEYILHPNGYEGTLFEDFLISMASFMAGFTGIVVMVKREFPSPSFLPIRGVIAIVTGLIITTIWWFFAYRGFYQLVWRLLH